MAEMNQWEYRVLTVGSAFSGPKDADLEILLDEWGEEGWEIISLSPIENSNKIRVVAKRLLAGKASKQSGWPGW